MAYSRYNCSSSHSILTENVNEITLQSDLKRKHQIILTKDLFLPENSLFCETMQGRAGMIVISSRVDKLYGKKIRQYVAEKLPKMQDNILVIECGEKNKNNATIERIIAKADSIRLDRQSPIVGIGGGICTDSCGLTASLFRRGVPHMKIPTTLVGLIDAGIGIKNGINFGSKKNLIGTFSPPEYSLIDHGFLPTLSNRHIICGVAEIIKMGIVVDKDIVTLLDSKGDLLVKTKFQYPVEEATAVIKKSILSMMRELSDNLFEIESYKRAVDFGHTFSPYIESVSNYSILHGEAVSMDMALTCQLAYRLGIFPEATNEELFFLFERLNLPIYSELMEPSHLFESLKSIEAHRGGNLNLVVPTSIGAHTFINKDDFGLSLLKEALDDLQKRWEQLQARSSSMVSQFSR